MEVESAAVPSTSTSTSTSSSTKSSSSAKRENFSAMQINPNASNAYNKFAYSRPGGLQSQSSGSAKKLVIKNLRAKPAVPTEFKERAEIKLRKAVVAIQQAKPIDSSLEELYAAVENLCTNGLSRQVYDDLKSLVEEHVKVSVEPFLGESLDKLTFMKNMNECWTSHCREMIMVGSIFLFLDRTYVLQNAAVLSIWDMGLDLFRSCALTHQLVQARTVDGILMLVAQERHGDVVDRSLLSSLLRMLSDLQIYKEAFEKKFMTATEKLYAAEGQRLVNDLEVPEYLTHVEKRLKEENERLLHYLDHSSKWQLIHTVETQLILKHMQTILSKGLDELLESNRKTELKLMYSLLGKVKGGHAELKTKICDYVKKRGSEIVQNPEKDKTMVQDLLDFKEKLDGVMEACFMSNEQFIVSMKEAMETFINRRQNKPAELIAKFVDSKLRAGNKEASEEEIAAARRERRTGELMRWPRRVSIR